MKILPFLYWSFWKIDPVIIYTNVLTNNCIKLDKTIILLNYNIDSISVELKRKVEEECFYILMIMIYTYAINS